MSHPKSLMYYAMKDLIHDCMKHDLAHDADEYAEQKINEMSNYEFLALLSNALEEMEAKK